MNESDISHYFQEFAPTQKQLRRLSRLIKRVHKSWGIDYGDSLVEATLILAPGNLSQLSYAAYHLLKRCQNRTWEFRVSLDRQYNPFTKETYEELFKLLLSLDLISDATPKQKLGGAKSASDLRSLLKSRGLSTKGLKVELTDRLVENLSTEEISVLIGGVILYRTTEAGNRALLVVNELYPRVNTAFASAVSGTSESFESKQQPPELPPGILYDDGNVRITESDVRRALGDLEAVTGMSEPVKSSEAERTVLTDEVVAQLVDDIEKSGDGWLTILISDRDDADFVQASFMNTYPDRQWYCDARGNDDGLAALGFVQYKDDPLPMKWVSRQEIKQVLFDTLRMVFGVDQGDVVWISDEVTGTATT